MQFVECIAIQQVYARILARINVILAVYATASITFHRKLTITRN